MANLILEKKDLLEQVDNDAEFLQTLIETFRSECPTITGNLANAVIERNPAEIANAAHSLRGSISIFVPRNSLAALRTLEGMGKSGKLEDVDEVFSVISRETISILESLKVMAESLS
jgi:hypothetical protein